MIYFLGGLAFLVAGYFAYGRVMRGILRPDDRPTPCRVHPDGVDFVQMPKWKNQLVQLLNIAGVGPVIGVILGIKFGKIALIAIPIGCVFLGAVHDFASGMMSLRNDGANLTTLVSRYLGRRYGRFFSAFLILLLLFVVAVFVNIPAGIADKTWLPDVPFFWAAVVVIFAYYVAATLFPVDKIIGRIYPFFGGLLILGSLALFIAIVFVGFRQPDLLRDCPEFAGFQSVNPFFPCLFVTIACGIISGFHATQSPIVARTMRSEREALSTFFGMMVLEGGIAMVWATAALAMYNMDAAAVALPPATVLTRVTTRFLGPWMGGVTVLAVVVLAVTSGDTALRSARLSLAEMCRIDQRSIARRVLTSLPLIAAAAGLLVWSNANAKTFGAIWNYFAWCNQVVAASALMTSLAWMTAEGKSAAARLTVLLPAVFMTTVVTTFILWASPAKGQVNGLVWGCTPDGFANTGLPLPISIAIGAVFATLCAFLSIRAGKGAVVSEERAAS